MKGQKQTGATDPVTPVLFLSRLGKILLLSVLSHDVFQLWRLDGFLDFKAELLIKFFCRLIAIKNGQGDAFDRVLLKNEIHKAFQRRFNRLPGNALSVGLPVKEGEAPARKGTPAGERLFEKPSLQAVYHEVRGPAVLNEHHVAPDVPIGAPEAALGQPRHVGRAQQPVPVGGGQR